MVLPSRLATLAILPCLVVVGCPSHLETRREPPLRRATPPCPAGGADECKARCGSGGAAPGSSEGQCEAVLDDLCRSHCEAACGGATATLAAHIAEQERILERQCGSGMPVEPGRALAPPPEPTPHPLNDLMKDDP